ncbi:hypothetical protein [Acuticoccus sp.]|uniref:hypothetical protein n=1 Tax=Acuticoccus sp. TaxID=1904378 RepID=UPI003B51899D
MHHFRLTEAQIERLEAAAYENFKSQYFWSSARSESDLGMYVLAPILRHHSWHPIYLVRIRRLEKMASRADVSRWHRRRKQ